MTRSMPTSTTARLLLAASAPAADGPSLEAQLSTRWIEAYASGDAEVMGAMYAPDARLKHGYCEALTSRAAITELWRLDLGEGEFSTQLELVDSFTTDDVGYISGMYSVRDNHITQNAGGSYTQIWRREDSAWSLYRESWINLACADIQLIPPSANPNATPSASMPDLRTL